MNFISDDWIGQMNMDWMGGIGISELVFSCYSAVTAAGDGDDDDENGIFIKIKICFNIEMEWNL